MSSGDTDLARLRDELIDQGLVESRDFQVLGPGRDVLAPATGCVVLSRRGEGYEVWRQGDSAATTLLTTSDQRAACTALREWALGTAAEAGRGPRATAPSSRARRLLGCTGLRASGRFAVLGGTGHAVMWLGETRARLWLDDDAPRLRGETDRGRSGGECYAEVPRDLLERIVEVEVEGIWMEAPVLIEGVETDRVAILYRQDPEIARAFGLEGSQHDGGWRGWVPRSDVTEVDEQVTEIPVRSPRR